MKIAIIGATGYIGKSLSHLLLAENKSDLFFVVRSKEKMSAFLRDIELGDESQIYTMGQLISLKCDAIINCAGIGDSSKLQERQGDIFKTTQEVDDIVIGYLKENPKTFYINLSSGAVYKEGINNWTEESLMANPEPSLSPDNYYSIAKMRSEALHRKLKSFNIVDIRVFAFFSRFVNTASGFFMSELIKSVKNKTTFYTTSDDIVRDYITTVDLLSFIKLILQKDHVNDFFDIYSKKPVSKKELLESFVSTYAFEYEIKNDLIKNSPTGFKRDYYSSDKKAQVILGYSPRFSAIEGILREAAYVLNED